MAIDVRDATAADATALADAHIVAWRAAYRGEIPDEYLDDPAFESSRHTGWTRRLRDGPPPGARDPSSRILVTVLDGRVVGFAQCGREAPRDQSPGDRGELSLFYLHPDAWGSGAADPLMQACLDEMRSRFERAILFVLEANPRARRFYERWGWECGSGDAIVRDRFELPPDDRGATFEPVVEIQYRIELR